MISTFSKSLIKRQSSTLVSRGLFSLVSNFKIEKQFKLPKNTVKRFIDKHCTDILRELLKNNYDAVIEDANGKFSNEAKSKVLHITTIYGGDLWIYEQEGRMPKPGEIIDRIEDTNNKHFD
ncbi:hypothetical protein M0813_04155 [Anaeramoeba flamelloides]|uniref:Uncharacterized protein n=1 Tax=Anaeramoeba flamelloides TaxID=1746091 RepID=A0AAV7YAI6_9EUKA|nr:hypothetical protein M0812_26371 [Anaeramoeba flamelloides]KAJ6234352.1 hypothetical protein M0813_04155 [Anaeramoeba flamelloides]